MHIVGSLNIELRTMYSVIPQLLRNLDVKPVLLHGDLWVRRSYFSHFATTMATIMVPNYRHHFRAATLVSIGPPRNLSFSILPRITDTTKQSE